MRYTSVGALLVCFAVTVGLFWSGETAQARPLLRAIENQEKAKSYRAVRRATNTAPQIPLEEEQKIYYADGKSRSESASYYSVANTEEKKYVFVKYSLKVASFSPLVSVVSEHAITSDTVKQAIAAREFKDLGIQVVDGRRLRTYRVEKPASDQTGGVATRSTYWIDAKRDLLVRTEFVGPILILNRHRDGTVSQFDQDFKDFTRTEVTEYLGFDEDLDPALFDTNPPAGFRLVEVDISPKPKR